MGCPQCLHFALHPPFLNLPLTTNQLQLRNIPARTLRRKTSETSTARYLLLAGFTNTGFTVACALYSKSTKKLTAFSLESQGKTFYTYSKHAHRAPGCKLHFHQNHESAVHQHGAWCSCSREDKLLFQRPLTIR